MAPVAVDSRPAHKDNLEDLFDYVARSFVYSGFRILNGCVYSVTSLRSVLSQYRPKSDGNDDNNRSYFNYYKNLRADAVKMVDFDDYRRNPRWRLNINEPSHFPVYMIESAIGLQLSSSQINEFRRRIARQRVEFDNLGLAEIDINGLNEAEEGDVEILRVVDMLAERRMNSSNDMIIMYQRQIDQVPRDTKSEINKIRRLHYKIRSQERLDAANFRERAEALVTMLDEFDDNFARRCIHHDDRVCELNKRILRTHRTNYDVISRLHNRMVRREERINDDEDLDYSDTTSDAEDDIYPVVEYLDVIERMNDRGRGKLFRSMVIFTVRVSHTYFKIPHRQYPAEELQRTTKKVPARREKLKQLILIWRQNRKAQTIPTVWIKTPILLKYLLLPVHLPSVLVTTVLLSPTTNHHVPIDRVEVERRKPMPGMF